CARDGYYEAWFAYW
nr:immunoglobulin heavy chain junction region [Mus musculus]MBK4195598.1 immunoglobulin heavy chain junction region [Mus musculus]MBK4195599.1 immunoglobulin heavy chain junction region [Mus musculus]MBK4195600.1 immunoglobulin heavy chain junction region [Mus musculus]MBK4195601.1 immunoglobulin heavy chain junction region [Mus musculus]